MQRQYPVIKNLRFASVTSELLTQVVCVLFSIQNVHTFHMHMLACEGQSIRCMHSLLEKLMENATMIFSNLNDFKLSIPPNLMSTQLVSFPSLHRIAINRDSPCVMDKMLLVFLYPKSLSITRDSSRYDSRMSPLLSRSLFSQMSMSLKNLEILEINFDCYCDEGGNRLNIQQPTTLNTLKSLHVSGVL